MGHSKFGKNKEMIQYPHSNLPEAFASLVVAIAIFIKRSNGAHSSEVMASTSFLIVSA